MVHIRIGFFYKIIFELNFLIGDKTQAFLLLLLYFKKKIRKKTFIKR